MTISNTTQQETFLPIFKAGALIKIEPKYWFAYRRYNAYNAKDGSVIYLPKEGVLFVVKAQHQKVCQDTWCNCLTVLYAEKLVDICSISVRYSVEEYFTIARSKQNGINKQKRP